MKATWWPHCRNNVGFSVLSLCPKKESDSALTVLVFEKEKSAIGWIAPFIIV